MVQGTGTVEALQLRKGMGSARNARVRTAKTGMLNFLADHSGNIYVNKAKYIATQYPDDPSRLRLD